MLCHCRRDRGRNTSGTNALARSYSRNNTVRQRTAEKHHAISTVEMQRTAEKEQGVARSPMQHTRPDHVRRGGCVRVRP